MYIYYPAAGVVVRVADVVTVAPTSDTAGVDYVEWLAWCDAGNTPTLGVEAPQPARLALTRLEFCRLFTFAERVGIDASADPVVRTFLTDLGMADAVNLDDADVIRGLAYLEGASLIAPGRAAEIRA
jgi:hypothetical protein